MRTRRSLSTFASSIDFSVEIRVVSTSFCMVSRELSIWPSTSVSSFATVSLDWICASRICCSLATRSLSISWRACRRSCSSLLRALTSEISVSFSRAIANDRTSFSLAMRASSTLRDLRIKNRSLSSSVFTRASEMAICDAARSVSTSLACFAFFISMSRT